MSELSRQQVRGAYTSFATGVTVMTAYDQDGRPCAMTASSLNPISLDPPLVSVSLTHGTPNYGNFLNCGAFSLSILSESQSDLARHFATPMEDKFAGIPTDDAGEGAPPVLSGGVAWLVCVPRNTFEVGDHTLLVAEVVRTSVADRAPLIYHRGTFFGVSPQVETEIDARRQRATMVGFIVEDDDRIALMPDAYASGSLTVPMTRLVGGRSNSEAVSLAGQRLFGEEIEIDFLYSVIDVNDTLTCLIYRGKRISGALPAAGIMWFAESEMPWDSIGSRSCATVLHRYFDERVRDQFGVFVNIGKGRIATVGSASEWEEVDLFDS
jgi:flavin reductase (DIM6/NTAB) family NADH-FMN oxidoreductase RutF